jgi:hypothetical protein
MINQSAVIGKLHFTLKIPTDTTSINTNEVISRARENLADTVPPFRWSDEQLAEFADGGMIELHNMRSDLDRMDAVPKAFTSPLANYVVYRALALDNDMQNNNGALSDKYLNLFIQQTAAIQYFFTDEQLGEYVDAAVLDLASVRPDLRIADGNILKEKIRIVNNDKSISYDLPERYTDALTYHAAANACQHSKNDAMNFYFEKYQGAWKTV